MAVEKDPFKLTSLDDQGARINIIPAEVRGRYRTRRTRIHAVLVLVLIALPWVKVGGHQALLLNISQQEFNFFGLLFRTHDTPLIFLVVAVLVMGLALVTAIWGRIWCGWACPQTVFIESIFRKIEVWTEGHYLQRRRFQKDPWTLTQFRRSVLKWALFVLVSSVLAHTLIAYFAGAEDLLRMMRSPPDQNWNYFLLVSGLTALILFDFAWFREQFCVIMCPYGRIQSVLLEPNSQCVVYHSERGEPRRNPQLPHRNSGDCVSCNRCVEVCPTGIDIRNGLQMECISCSACIDACDEIMSKLQKPKGLISYRSLNGTKLQILKPKTVFYIFIILCSTSALAYQLIGREPLSIALLRGVGAPYSITQNDQGEQVLQNHFRLRLTNQTSVQTQYLVELSPESISDGFKMTVAQNPVVLKEKSTETLHVFIHLPAHKLPSEGFVVFGLELRGPSLVFPRSLTFVGPSR